MKSDEQIYIMKHLKLSVHLFHANAFKYAKAHTRKHIVINSLMQTNNAIK